MQMRTSPPSAFGRTIARLRATANESAKIAVSEGVRKIADSSVSEFKTISGISLSRFCNRDFLQLLDLVAAFLQQIDHAVRAGEMPGPRDDGSWYSGLHFRFDSRKPSTVALIEQSLRDLAILFAQTFGRRRKSTDISIFPRRARFIEASADLLAVKHGREQHRFAVELEHVFPERDVLIHRLETARFLAKPSRFIGKVIVDRARADSCSISAARPNSQRRAPKA